MRRHPVVVALALLHAAAVFSLFAVALYDTLITYPEWFGDIPHSLERAYETMSGSRTSWWIGTLSAGSVATALALAAAGWREAFARNLVLGSTAVILLVAAVTAVYFEPLITVLVRQGARVYTNDVLRAEARQFQQINWIRLVNLAGAAFGLSLPGVLRFLKPVGGRQ